MAAATISPLCLRRRRDPPPISTAAATPIPLPALPPSSRRSHRPDEVPRKIWPSRRNTSTLPPHAPPPPPPLVPPLLQHRPQRSRNHQRRRHGSVGASGSDELLRSLHGRLHPQHPSQAPFFLSHLRPQGVRLNVTERLPPTPTTFSTLISHLSKSGKINDACSVLNHMIRSGRRPNPFCYTPILQALCSRGRTGEAEALIKAMEEAGCASHTVAKNILLSGFCRRRDFPAAERLLAAPGWRPNIVTFNIFINGLCNAGKIEEAFSQLAVMAAQRLTPSAVTINILLRCICLHSGAEEGKKLLDESWRLGWEVNAVDFNAVMSSFSATGKWAAAPPLLAGMVKMGVKPDARSFNILIFCLCREGKFQKGRTILENGGFKANTITYNTLIGGFCAAGHVAAAEELVSRMVEMNVEQDLATWTIRIEWLCKEKRIKEAKEVFRGLKRRFLPDLVVFRVLIGGMVGEGDVAGGRKLVREMVGQGLTPDVATVDFVIRVFCRSGFCGSGEICIIVGEMLSYI